MKIYPNSFRIKFRAAYGKSKEVYIIYTEGNKIMLDVILENGDKTISDVTFGYTILKIKNYFETGAWVKI